MEVPQQMLGFYEGKPNLKFGWWLGVPLLWFCWKAPNLHPRHACWHTWQGFLMLPQLPHPPGRPSPWHSAQAQTPADRGTGKLLVHWQWKCFIQCLSSTGFESRFGNQLGTPETDRYAAINSFSGHSLANTGRNKTMSGCQDKNKWSTKEPTTEGMSTHIMFLVLYIVYINVYNAECISCTCIQIYIGNI